MWEQLLRVDWARLTHAYGFARNAPKILRGMVSSDQNEQAVGWDAFWGSLNHQGDFYDSTVAVVALAVIAAIAGVNMAVCLVILMLAPAVTVVGYEMEGYRHQADALAKGGRRTEH